MLFRSVPTKTIGLKSLHLQESRVHYTLAGIKSPLKRGEGGVPWRERGGGGNISPGYAPVKLSLIGCNRETEPDVLMHTQFFVSYTPSVKGTPQLK